MSRLSKFVHFISAENQRFAYDLSSLSAVVLNNRLYELIVEHSNHMDEVYKIHPDLFNNMRELGMVVDDNFDEFKDVIRHFKAIDSDSSIFDIIINPTLDCNLLCWYCYETHGRGTMMPKEIMESVKKLISNKLSEKSLSHLRVSFFGGEPIIGWNDIVIPILEFATESCIKHSVRLSVTFTTNGILLDKEKFDKLIALGLNDTSFQITFDGNRTIHNNSRVGDNKKPTYDRILKNVIIGASKGFLMNLRFNFTPDNLASFIDVLTDLDDLTAECKKQINCNFQKIWQAEDRDTSCQVINMIDLFQDAGIRASCDVPYSRHLCYADRQNQITINYNGDLFKCTAREFDPKTREGVLLPDGSIELNRRYTERMELKYSNKQCCRCPILPICNGQCSQSKLENPNVESCIMGYDDDMRQRIIKGSFYYNIFKKLIPIKHIDNSNQSKPAFSGITESSQV